ncbi:hypothetical protein GCM10020220_046910 [Nonomuraea rubra]
MALGVEGGLQPGEQVVEGVAELGQLVGGAAEVQAPVEVPGGDDLGGGGDGAQRSQEPSGDVPAEGQGDGDQDGQGDGGPDEELGQADAGPCAGDRARCGEAPGDARVDAGERGRRP